MRAYDVDTWMLILVFAIVYFALLLGALWYLRSRREQRRQREEDRKESLESKVRLLGETAARAVDLSNQVQVQIDALSEAADQARQEAATAEAAASLSREAKAAVETMIRSELKTSDRRGVWTNVVLSAVFFVLGIAASVIVNLTVTPANTEPEPEPTSFSLQIAEQAV